jgi:hypothetical protein
LLVRAALVAAATVSFVSEARAQQTRSERGQPTTPISVTDFSKLRWLSGDWLGSAPGERPLYARYRFSDDSTIAITYFRDSTFSTASADARVYLTVGRVYHTFGPSRWGATRVDTSGVFFIPQVMAHNTFAWRHESPNEWTSTRRSSYSGHEEVTVYHMRRVGR